MKWKLQCILIIRFVKLKAPAASVVDNITGKKNSK